MITDLHEKFDVLLQNEGDHECEGIGKDKVCVRVVAMAELPTRFGEFHIVAFENNRDGKEHVAIIKGDVIGAKDVPVRLHSECLTGDALGSLRCDCRDQLEASLKMIGAMGRGMVLYLRQEGRGIGLVNKIRAYSLQDQGLDTVEANHALGFRDDERDYAVAAHMLMSLKIESIRLITNNPKKIQQLIDYGINVSDRIPHIMEPNEYNRFYLETKAAKSGHMIDFHGKEHLPEQSDRPFIKGMSELPVDVLSE
ncbi:MAG TPA: GTP cyclohydrolase II [Anaerolineales bacterium]|nr:GTP cyclohydrolase II [Anaerolineales bacterium]HMR97647.1 GTP cyclohydrolase II [Anaerolineales bacterium]HNQ93065.1 GTP cyclohydrolase II [Anaerolineales bacterium]HNS61597.1 GTP cyclohydrolase II [Anaerolineales bacterium]